MSIEKMGGLSNILYLAFAIWVVWETGTADLKHKVIAVVLIGGALLLAFFYYKAIAAHSERSSESRRRIAKNTLEAARNAAPDRGVDQTDWRKLFEEEKKAREEEAKARNELQKKYTEASNKILELQSALSQPPTPRAKMISLCDEIRCFSARYGPTLVVERNPNEEADDYISRKWQVQATLQSKMGADFRLNFGVRVENLRDEIEVRYGKTSSLLDTAIASAQSPLCDPATIELVRSELWTLGLAM